MRIEEWEEEEEEEEDHWISSSWLSRRPSLLDVKTEIIEGLLLLLLLFDNASANTMVALSTDRATIIAMDKYEIATDILFLCFPPYYILFYFINDNLFCMKLVFCWIINTIINTLTFINVNQHNIYELMSTDPN